MEFVKPVKKAGCRIGSMKVEAGLSKLRKYEYAGDLLVGFTDSLETRKLPRVLEVRITCVRSL